MTTPLVHRLAWSNATPAVSRSKLHNEWLVTNGLGGYASGTLAGAPTRRYHGLLVAALPAPLGRTMVFNHVVEDLRLRDGTIVHLSGDASDGTPLVDSLSLASFALEFGLPVWRYEFGPYVLERRVLLPHRSNTVHLSYKLLAGPSRVRLRLRPGFHFRPHEAPVSGHLTSPYLVMAQGDRFEVTSPDFPPLRMRLSEHHGALVLTGGQFYEVHYAHERARGYEDRDVLWSPGYLRIDLHAEQQVTLSASTDPWESLLSSDATLARKAELERRARLLDIAEPRAREGIAAELVLAADQFIITPTTRMADAARAHAAGDEIRSVIAGYHWFTDWGRDTMISLEGLTLVTGRHAEAGYILRTFAHYVRDGLIPNLFPEGELEGRYHTADATWWFFHALDRYLAYTGDRATLRLILPTLRDIIDHHLRGTHFGMGVDPEDGLLRQGQEGYQLTWMDAKVGDWVVTPRRGKAVEINALWYNALQCLARWLAEEGMQDEAASMGERARRARGSFNVRFWNPAVGWCYDVIDGELGDDASLRPNQVFAISLPHPVLDEEHWPSAMRAVSDHLLTPMGLRTLAPFEPAYKARYDGDLRARDAAYHQGTVWPWLMGPYLDALARLPIALRIDPREILAAFGPHLQEACVGTISEIFDAEAPYEPRGCAAQAWSVAEVLRSWVKGLPPT